VRGIISEGTITDYFGTVKNLRVKVSRAGLRIRGSLSSFLYDNNDQYLCLEDIEAVIFYIGSLLDTPIDRALIRGLDFGLDIEVDSKPQLYLAQFSETSSYTGFHRYPKSITFITNSRKKMLYDKTLNIKGAKTKQPYRIRYELRWKNTFIQRKIPFLRVSDLARKQTIHILLDYMYEEFFSMKRRAPLSLKSDQVQTPKDFVSQLAAIAINKIGEEQIYSIINEIIEGGGLKVKSYPSRARALFRSLQAQYQAEKGNTYFEEFSSRMNTQLERMRLQLNQLEN
jgi:hypothetical protein